MGGRGRGPGYWERLPYLRRNGPPRLVRPSNRAVAGSGTVKFDIPHRLRAVYGRQLGIARSERWLLLRRRA
jgi:hypothetical protein